MHSYPKDLADFVRCRWDTCPEFGEVCESGPLRLPAPHVLDDLLSVCYQASLLRDEDRVMRFRVMALDPHELPADAGPPVGLHRLVFTEPLNFNEFELRRLSSGADFYRTLIGVRTQEAGGLHIWGLVHSGPYWASKVRGAQSVGTPLPDSLIVWITGPGRITVCRGAGVVGILNAGKVFGPMFEVFDSTWLPDVFKRHREALWRRHAAARAAAKTPWATLDPKMAGVVGRHSLRSIISTIRDARHGGVLLLLPHEQRITPAAVRRFLSIKYEFAMEESRDRFQSLMLQLLNAVAAVFGERGNPTHMITWDDYIHSSSRRFTAVNEAFLEWTQLVAALAAVDGAVVLNTGFELIGFGGMILGDFESISPVFRALDLEGTKVEPVNVNVVGSRHRSAYYMCDKVPGAIAVVISQDGAVTFVTKKGDSLICWDQIANNILDV